MNFAALLKELLYITRLKSGHLAAALGYDTSYISRWVNGVKLPSLKNNEELLRNIARFFIANSGAEQLASLRRRFGGAEDALMSPAALEDVMTRQLGEAYSAQVGSDPAREGRVAGGNAEIIAGRHRDQLWDLMITAASEVGRDGSTEPLGLFTLTPLHYFSNRDSDFLDRLRRAVPANRPINIRQFIHFGNLERHRDDYCRTICSFLSYEPADIRYDFYELSERVAERNTALVLRDGIFVQWLETPFSDTPYVVTTRSREMVNELYNGMESYTRKHRRLIERHTNAELYAAQYYMNYLMHGSFRYLLTTMHPISMEPGLLRELSAGRMRPGRGQDWGVAFTEKTFTLPRSAVIYKSAMMSYLYDGVITLFDRTFTLSKDERVRHLRGLIDALQTDPELDLTIIEDVNPVMCRRELNISAYMSDGAVFARGLSRRGSPEPPTYTFTSSRLIDAMNGFYRDLQALPDEYALRGQRVVDFLTHGIALI